MRYFLSLAILLSVSCFAEDIPIKDGRHKFHHRYAEHPNIESITLDVQIQDGHIIVINNDKDDVFHLGEIDRGELFWHEKTQQWIIVNSDEDKKAVEVGGCTDGPTNVDLVQKIYWTC